VKLKFTAHVGDHGAADNARKTDSGFCGVETGDLPDTVTWRWVP